MRSRKLLLTLSLFGLAACSPKSETLVVQPSVVEEKVEIPKYDDLPEQKFDWITEDGGQSQLEFNPQIDILFVVDNSDSMKSAQDNLKKNIGKFSEGIIQNKMIDFHIGVISTWDSSERAIKGKRDPYEIGDLRHIKDVSGKSYRQRYLDRKISTPDVLASSIHIGVAPYTQGGPEIEEFFSPLAAALEKTGHGAANEGFFRDDAQLVVIIMTDADDSTSRISPEQMAQTLVDFKKGNSKKISVYGVLVRPEDPDTFKDYNLKIHPDYHPECFEGTGRKKKNNGTCKGFGPTRLQELIVKANPNGGNSKQIQEKFIMPITSPKFGADLSRIGGDITIKTLEKTIFLSQRPRFDEKTNQFKVRVRYGKQQDLADGKGQLIPPGEQGWLYNADDNSIQLSGHIKYQYVEGGRFAVDLIPLTIKQ